MKLNLTIILSLFLIGYQSVAQQLPQSNLYIFNKYNINPAYAGYNNCLELYGSHLSQWVGIGDAPKTNYFSAHSRFRENMGLGGGIIVDNASFVNRFSAKLTYAYRIKLGEDQNLRLGLSAGVFQVNVDATSAIVDDQTDEIVSGGAQSGVNFDSDFGLFYNLKGFQLGVSIPQVFESEAQLRFQGIEGYTGKRHYVAYAGYDWKLNDKFNLEPSVLYRTAQSGLNQTDFNATVTYNKLLSIGGGFRTHVGFLARLGINIKDVFYLGYAHEFSGMNISSYSNGSHEIMLALKFCKDPSKKKDLPIVEEEIEDSSIDLDSLVEDIESEEEIKEEEVLIEEEIVEVKEETEEAKPFKETYSPQILFPFNNGEDFNLSDNSDLKDLAKFLSENKNEKAVIIGHACDVGGAENNLLISKMRAQKVYDELVKMGTSPNQLTMKAEGESKPLYPNSTEANRIKNRRVEIKFE